MRRLRPDARAHRRSVQPPGIELTVLPMPSPERHWRMMRFEEFDVAELSMSHYLCAFAEQRELHRDPRLPPPPLPPLVRLLPNRRRDRGAARPERQADRPPHLSEHRGRLDAGHPGGRATASTSAASSWFTQDEEETPWDPPSWLHIERVPAGTNIDRMIVERRARRGDLPGDSALVCEGRSARKAALRAAQRGRAGLLQADGHLPDHAHGGGDATGCWRSIPGWRSAY